MKMKVLGTAALDIRPPAMTVAEFCGRTKPIRHAMGPSVAD